jgi:tetratricopeptide (TPR) repeat protein
MNSKNLETHNIQGENNLFFEINQQSFTELLTFVDFADDKLNIGLVKIKFTQDRDTLLKALIEHPKCQNIQFEILDFPSPNLRFLRDKIVTALKQIKIKPNKKLILLITGLEKSIGIVEEYPAVLTNLNFVRDDLRTSVPHPILFFLPDYALTRLAKYAPDFWAWGRKVFYFKTNRSNLIKNSKNIVFSDNFVKNLELPAKQERIELLLDLLNEYNSVNEKEPENNLLTISNIYNQLGNAYDSLGGYQKAINYYQQSLEIKREIGDRHGIGSSLRGLGNAYYSLGNYQQAIDYLEQSLEIAQEIGDRHGISICLGNLGNAYYSLGEYQQAIDYYQQSLEIKREIGDRHGISNCLIGLGSAYRSLGEYQQAIDYHQQSLEIKREIGDRNGISKSLIGLGNAYYSLGKYQKAIDCLQQSLEIAQEIGDRYGEANTWFNLGHTHKNLQQKLEAKTAYENARNLYQAMGLDNKVEDCNKAIQSLEE